MNEVDARAKLAAALAPLDDGDPVVLVDLVDSLEPPALMLNWADPAIDPEGILRGACMEIGRLQITAVAHRLMPGPGVATIESLWFYTRRRLALDPSGWPKVRWDAPRWFTIGGTTYLASRGVLTIPIQGGF